MSLSGKKYVLVGPSVERFKGGVAQFTSHLAERLPEKIECHFFSWYQPYPTFLTSRDFVDKVSKPTKGLVPANFLLGYMNPLSWWKFVKEVKALKATTVCFTWIHPVQAPVYFVLTCLIKLLTDADIIFICHNVLPHESFRGDRLLTKLGLSGADRLIVHGISEQTQVNELFRKKRSTRIFLPLHNFFSSDTEILDDNEAEPDRPLRVLFFGVIRHYKGLDILLKALAIVVKTNPDIQLHIIGEKFLKNDRLLESADPEKLIDSLELRDYIKTDFRYVSNEEVPAIFSQADLAVFPYRSATQSGPITVAYSYGVPVVSTRTGGIPDVVVDGVNGYLVEPNDEHALADGILKYIDKPIPKSSVESFAEMLSWDSYTHCLLNDCDFEFPKQKNA